MENLVITDFLATNRIYYECLRSFLATESLRNQRVYTMVSDFLQRRQNRILPIRSTQTLGTNTNTRTLSHILDNVSIYKYSDISTNVLICAISRENFTNDDIIIKINNCNHIFKCKYLLRWFETHSTCPTCRYNILSHLNNSLPVTNNPLSVTNNPLSATNNPLSATNNSILNTISESLHFLP